MILIFGLILFWHTLMMGMMIYWSRTSGKERKATDRIYHGFGWLTRFCIFAGVLLWGIQYDGFLYGILASLVSVVFLWFWFDLLINAIAKYDYFYLETEGINGMINGHGRTWLTWVLRGAVSYAVIFAFVRWGAREDLLTQILMPILSLSLAMMIAKIVGVVNWKIFLLFK